MSYDIYGQSLRRGYCEVHPDVPQPYPCVLCQAREREERLFREAHERMRREEEDAYYSAMRGEMEYESWIARLEAGR